MEEPKEIKQALHITMNALCELIYQWNMLSDDGDRGISNDGIALILYDDGSGKVCTYWAGSGHVGDQLNPQIPQFDTVEEGVEELMKWIGED
jgi:hypothetical protein